MCVKCINAVVVDYVKHEILRRNMDLNYKFHCEGAPDVLMVINNPDLRPRVRKVIGIGYVE